MVGDDKLIFSSLSCNHHVIFFDDYGVVYTWFAVKMFYSMGRWINALSVVVCWICQSPIGPTHAQECILSGLVALILRGILPEEMSRSNCLTRFKVLVLLM